MRLYIPLHINPKNVDQELHSVDAAHGEGPDPRQIVPCALQVSSSKLQLQFAKAKEAESRYAEAAGAYEAAGDMDRCG